MTNELVNTNNNVFTISDVAKSIGLNPRDLFSYLNEKKWIFKRNNKSKWRPCSDIFEKGYMKNKFFAKLTRSGIIRLNSMLKAEVDLLQ